MDRVQLLIQLTGDQAAMSSLKNLKTTVDTLNKSKINLQIQKNDIDRQIASVKKEIADLTAQKRQISLKADSRGVALIQREINTLQEKLNELTEKKRNIEIDSRFHNAGIRSALQEMDELERKGESVRRVFENIGSGLQGLGGVISNVGNSLQSLGNAMGGNFLNKVTTTLTAYGTILATQGLGKSIERYDTFRTFPKLMEQIGYSTEEAEKAINQMNDAVLGLPTSLNEIVESSKNYIQLTGDIQKGTRLAIAANNAFLANASDASQVYQGMRQINDILSKGELRTMEWMSLFTSLGTSLAPIAEQMGFASDEIGAFRTQLSEGTIDAKDFIDALIEVGTGTGALVERANIQKDTLTATISNIKNAFSILGGAVLEELNSLFEDYTGEGLPANIKKISDAIKDKLIPAVRGWLQQNGDRIMAFVDRIKNIDWMGIISSIAKNLETLFSVIGKIFDFLNRNLPDGWLATFIGFGTVMASPLGRATTMLGNLVTMLGKMVGKIPPVTSAVGKLGGALAGLGVGGGVALGIIGAISAGLLILYNRAKKAREAFNLESQERTGLNEVNEIIADTQLSRETGERNVQTARDNLDLINETDVSSRNLISTIRELNGQIDSETLKGEALANAKKELATAVEQLNAIYPEWGLQIDSVTGKLDDNSQSVLTNAERLKQAVRLQAEQELLAQQTTSLMSARMERDRLTGNIADLNARNRLLFSDARWGYFKLFEQEYGRTPQLGRFGGADGEFNEFLRQHGYDQFNTQEPTGWSIEKFLMEANNFQAARSGLNTELAEWEATIAELEQSTDGMAENIAETATAMETEANSARMSAEALSVLEEQYNATRKASEEFVRSQYLGYEELAEAETMALDAMLENIKARNEAIQNFDQNVQSVGDFLDAEGMDIPETFWQQVFAGDFGDATVLMNSLAEGLKNGDTTAVQDVIAGLMQQAINSAAASETVTNMQTAQELLNEKAIEAVTDYIDAVETELENGEKTISDAAEKAGNAADISKILKEKEPDAETSAQLLMQAVESGIISEKQAIVTAMQTAGQEAVDALKAKLSNISIDANVVVKPNVTVMGGYRPTYDRNFGVISKGYKAEGGMVYASEGKFIHFKPKGTDTVPAMLTPGEFVQRRAAVSTFGRDFMEKVNSLNIRGAIESLSKRFTPPSASGMNITNNNQQYQDRHDQHHYVFKTDNPRVADTFVGRALGMI